MAQGWMCASASIEVGLVDYGELLAMGNMNIDNLPWPNS
jgi:hypothetical protein